MTSELETTPEPTAKAPRPEHHGSALRRMLSSRRVEGSLTFFAFLVLFAFYGIWLGSLFLDVDGRLINVHQNVPILLLGLAALITLVAGQFDLSIASMATLTTFLTVGLVAQNDWPFALVIVFCLAVGMAGGLLNGFLVEFLRVNAFIATLGTAGVFIGISRVYSKGAQITPVEGGPQLPQWFTDFGRFTTQAPWWILTAMAVLAAVGAFRAANTLRPHGWSDNTWRAARAAGLALIALILLVPLKLTQWIENSSWTILLLLVVALVMWVLLEQTGYGRYLKATGGNREAARLAGVKVRRETMRAFVIGGLLAALAGIVLAASQAAATPDVGEAYLLPAFAAAFLSTVIFSTGQFTVWGVIIGGIFVVWVSQGLILGGVPSTWTDVVNGVVLVLAVALSSVMRRRST